MTLGTKTLTLPRNLVGRTYRDISRRSAWKVMAFNTETKEYDVLCVEAQGAMYTPGERRRLRRLPDDREWL